MIIKIVNNNNPKETKENPMTSPALYATLKAEEIPSVQALKAHL